MITRYYAAIAEDFGSITHYRIIVHVMDLDITSELYPSAVLARVRSEIDANIVTVNEVDSISGHSSYMEYRSFVW